jgi:hypothetical protein
MPHHYPGSVFPDDYTERFRYRHWCANAPALDTDLDKSPLAYLSWSVTRAMM